MATSSVARMLKLAAAAALPAAAAGADVHHVPLNANFNGIFHAGEGAAAPDGEGYRSISDRGLDFSSDVPAGLALTGMPGSALSYAPVDAPFVLDIVHLGNRDTVDNGNWAFDDAANGGNIGVQPAWLADPDQTGPQTTALGAPVLLNEFAQVGVLYQVSNEGADLDVVLGFSDATSVTVTLNGPDWFGAAAPDAPGPGAAWQASLGTFPGVDSVDAANQGGALNVAEAVISAEQVQTDLGFDMSGRTLVSVTFQNRVCDQRPCGVAIVALSVDDGAGVTPPCSVDLDVDGDADVFDLLAYLDGWFIGCP